MIGQRFAVRHSLERARNRVGHDVTKNHLLHYPVSFGPAIEVECVTLDSYARERQLGTIDFIWADIQGSEGDMIQVGRELLRRTRHLYTEYSDAEVYEGQVTLSEILTLLPDYRVLELWPGDVLLENTSLR